MSKRKKTAEIDAHLFDLNDDDDEQDEVQEIYSIRAEKASTSALALSAKIGKKVKGPMDLLLNKNPEAHIKLGRLRGKKKYS